MLPGTEKQKPRPRPRPSLNNVQDSSATLVLKQHGKPFTERPVIFPAQNFESL